MSSPIDPKIAFPRLQSSSGARLDGAASFSNFRSPANSFGLGSALREIALARPGAPAITSATGSINYSQLLIAAECVARKLAGNSAFHPGDRAILLLPNSVEYIVAFYGVLLAGGVAVPVPVQTESNLLREILQSTEAVQIIASERVADARHDLQGLARESWDIDLSISSLPGQTSTATSISENDLAAIFFTAGSTGTPKGVMLSHRNLISNARSIVQYLGIRNDDRPLCVLPFHHAFGNSVLQSHLLVGAHLILDGSTSFPQTLVEALVRHNCTSLSGVPDLFRLLLDRTSLGSVPISSLRYMAVAGGSLPHQLSIEVQRRIEPARFYVMYGQTEATARLAYIPPFLLPEALDGCIGQAVPDVTLEVVDDQGKHLPAGVVGELRASGPNIMLGYWRAPEATLERLRDGWLYTGDLATTDAVGRIWLKGRRNALVKIAGYRVHPAELENFATGRLGAIQAVAVPFDVPVLGTRFALFLRSESSSNSLALPEMVNRCRAELPRHLVPELIEVVNEFPLNAALKIDRPLLTRRALESPLQRRIRA